MHIVPQRTTAYLTVTFRAKDGVAVAPESVDYRIDCLTTSTAIKASTAVSPAATVEIVLSADDNDIVDETNTREARRVTVTAVYGAGDEANDEFDYAVKNLSGV